MRRRIYLCLIVPLLTSAAPAAGAELITNGSFEVPVVDLSQAFIAGDPAITGWTIGAASVDVTSADYFGPAYEGAQYADLEGSPGPGSISQSFPTNPGATYKLLFAYSRAVPGVEFFGADPSTALVTLIGSNPLLSETFESSLTGSESIWTPVTRFFVADSALSTLTFASNDGSAGYYGGIQIDGVSVELVPEPASLALAALGVLGLIRPRRSRAT